MTCLTRAKLIHAVLGMATVSLIVGCGGGSKSSSSSSGASGTSAAPAYDSDRQYETGDTGVPGPSDTDYSSHDGGYSEGAPAPDGSPDSYGGRDPYANSGYGGYGDGGGDGGGQPEELSTDYSTWTAEQFAAAKKNSDQKLADAVAYLDENKSSDNDAAEILKQLLVVETPEPPADGAAESGDAGAGDGGYGRDPYARDGYGSSGGYGAEPQAIQVDDTLARQIISALARNTSETARKTMLELVSNRIKTPLDESSIFEAALQGIVGSSHPDKEKLYYLLMTQPAKVIPKREDPPAEQDGGGREGEYGYGDRGFAGGYGGFGQQLTVDSVRAKTIELIKETASVEFREKVAKYLNDPQVTKEAAEPIERWLSEDQASNVAAQLVMYVNPVTSDATHQSIDQQLMRRSTQALNYLLGLETDPSQYAGTGGGGYGSFGGRDVGYGRDGYGAPGGGFDRGSGRPSRDDGGRPSRDEMADGGGEPAAQPDEKEILSGIAQRMWTAALSRRLAAKVKERFDSQDDQSNPGGAYMGGDSELKFLQTLPTPESRAAIAELIEQFADEGPTALTSAGLLGSDISDPGIILLAKEAYHNRRSARARPSSRDRRRSTTDGYGVGGGTEGASPEDAWSEAVGGYVRNLQQVFASSESPWTDSKAPPTAESETPSGLLAAMPVELHR
ncbi:MAG: hypothetical protein KDA99_05845, partial [Planctomycetales bacterium]|nr:hypothetical protein [Planctomycetales bacterium]